MHDRPVVAIDDKLTHIKETLKNEGFDVVNLRHAGSQAEAIVVSGMDDNLMGIQETSSDSTVIDAAGLDANEIVEQVRRSIGLRE